MASSNIEQAIYTHLRSSTAVHDEVADRVHFTEAPQDETMPYVVFATIDDPHEPFSFDNKDSGQPRIQISTYDNDRYNVLDVANAIRGVLKFFEGSMDGLEIETLKCSAPIIIRQPDQSYWGAVFDSLLVYYDS